MRPALNFRLPGFAQEQCHRPMTWLLAVLLSGISCFSLAEAKSTTHSVTIEALQFSPPNLEVKAGDTVTWNNKDAFPHNVTAENKSFHSADMLSGRSWTFKASKKGVFPYVCTLHPTMRAVLIVK